MDEDRSSFKILTNKLTGKRTLGRPSHRSDDVIKMNLKEISVNIRFGFIRLRTAMTTEPSLMRN